MTSPFALVAEPAKRLTGREECDLLKRACNERAAPALTLRLAQLHNRLDEFDEAIALLEGAGAAADYETAQAWITALFGRGSDGDDARALQFAEQSEHLADSDRRRAQALSDQVKAMLWMGESGGLEQRLLRAMALDPGHAGVFRQLTNLWLDQGKASQVLTLVAELAAGGVTHSQLIGTQSQALVQSGDVAAAYNLVGLPQFLRQRTLDPPPGWNDLADFNAALARELLESPGLRNGRHGTASVGSLRVDEPATAATPAMRALQQAIVNAIMQFVEDMPSGDHPWLARRPASAQLRMWSVITDADGWERWHMHPLGWATGGYYVAVPEEVQNGHGAEGCLAFGLPSHRIGEAAAQSYGGTLLRPSPGLLTLFPSHAYHRTHPHGVQGRRICVAFDVMPD